MDEVTRMHHAVEYEMKTAAAPEKAMAKRRVPRESEGLQRNEDGRSALATDGSRVDV